MTVDPANLRRLLDAATPRPWQSIDVGLAIAMDHRRQDATVYAIGTRSQANKDLIVAAINALPELLDRIDEYAALAQAGANQLAMINSELAPMHVEYARMEAEMARIRPVYEAACAATDAQMLSNATDRRSRENVVWRAVDTARKARSL